VPMTDLTLSDGAEEVLKILAPVQLYLEVLLMLMGPDANYIQRRDEAQSRYRAGQDAGQVCTALQGIQVWTLVCLGADGQPAQGCWRRGPHGDAMYTKLHADADAYRSPAPLAASSLLAGLASRQCSLAGGLGSGMM
jgi:hypothetical protein